MSISFRYSILSVARFRLRHLPSYRKGEGLLSPFRLYSRKNSSSLTRSISFHPSIFFYFKLLIRWSLVSLNIFSFFLSSKEKRTWTRNSSRETTTDGLRSTKFDLTHPESIYLSFDCLHFATYNWYNSRGNRSIPLFDRMPFKLVQNFIDQHGSYESIFPYLSLLLYQRKIKISRSSRVEFPWTTRIRGNDCWTISRERERVCETCIISIHIEPSKLQIDGITEGRPPLLYRINDICVMRK